jgi:hypothetical protein
VHSEIKLVVQPQVGRYRPDSYDHLLQQQIEHWTLHPHTRHTLIHAEVAPGGGHAVLTVRSHAETPMRLDRHLRVVNGTPLAHVRAVTPDRTEIWSGQLAAPLRGGARVDIAGTTYQVASTTWPGRDPETGVCRGDVDWQEAVLIDVETLHDPRAVHAPTAPPVHPA